MVDNWIIVLQEAVIGKHKPFFKTGTFKNMCVCAFVGVCVCVCVCVLVLGLLCMVCMFSDINRNWYAAVGVNWCLLPSATCLEEAPLPSPKCGWTSAQPWVDNDQPQ